MGTLKKVYILHGWAYSADRWESLVNLLKKSGARVELLKIPGLTEKISKPWEIRDYIDWLSKRVEVKAVLIGHSNGGRIALNFAIENPEKVSQIFLIDSAGIYHNELPLRLKRILFKGVAKTGKKIAPSGVLKKILYKLARASDYYEAPEQMKTTLVNLTNSDKLLNLEKVSLPTTIIWGDKDSTTPLEDAFKMKEAINKSKLFIIKSARHSPQFTHSKEVAKIILEELK